MNHSPSESETATLANPDEAHTSNTEHRHPVFVDQNGPKTPPTHDPRRADLSFPFETTDLERGGFTDEYRAATHTGFVSADTALRPIPSHVSTIPGALRDLEKAATLKDTQLVTWLENDPEDPRNWSNLYRWCEYICYFLAAIDSLLINVFQISRLFVRCPSLPWLSQVL